MAVLRLADLKVKKRAGAFDWRGAVWVTSSTLSVNRWEPSTFSAAYLAMGRCFTGIDNWHLEGVAVTSTAQLPAIPQPEVAAPRETVVRPHTSPTFKMIRGSLHRSAVHKYSA